QEYAGLEQDFVGETLEEERYEEQNKRKQDNERRPGIDRFAHDGKSPGRDYPHAQPGFKLFHILQAADESPASAQLTDPQHELVLAFLERQIHGIVLGVDDPEESRIAESLRATAAPQDLAVQEDAHVVAVTDLKLFDLIAIALDGRLRVEQLHTRLRLQT